MQNIDQGTIFFGVKSDRYPDKPCYGIVLSASCDLANNKIDKIYFAIAVEVNEWLQTNVARSLALKDKLKMTRKNIEELLPKYKLNSVIFDFTDSEIDRCLSTNIKKTKDLKNLKNKLDEFKFLSTMDNPSNKDQFVACYSDLFLALLKSIDKGERVQFYYLPNNHFKDGDLSDNINGFIIDFQEIYFLSAQDVAALLKGEIDALTLQNDQDALNKLSRVFWLKSNTDFADIYVQIKSPCREHIMQRFSNYFSRIGLEETPKETYQNIINNLGGKNNVA